MKKQENLHLAQYIIIARTRYVNELGQTVRSVDTAVGRAHSQMEANRYIREINSVPSVRQAGYDADGAVYKNSLTKAPNLTMINYSSGELIKEVIDSFTIVTKQEYFNMEI